ncbi:MAG: 4Fe-4S ferredoxin [Chloroflexi bacterium]|nr:4Fe-4S ferredoxin [Chloroflexota bacterium]
MCQWCERYGQGYERWYFNPENYARKMYKIRKEETEAAGAEANPQAAGGMSFVGREFFEALDRGDRATADKIKNDAEQAAWVTHFGQVITLEDALRVIDIMYPIAVLTCGCRRSMQGLADENNFTCMGMGPGMYKWERWPDTYRGGVEFLSPAEAKDFVTKLNKKGLVQSLYTFGTPYLGGLCNCDSPDCASIRLRVDHGVKALVKGHEVARVDAELCNGCAQCIQRCQFRALNYSPTMNKAFIDQFQCFGCGLCATECPQDAIKLIERASLPALANEW